MNPKTSVEPSASAHGGRGALSAGARRPARDSHTSSRRDARNAARGPAPTSNLVSPALRVTLRAHGLLDDAAAVPRPPRRAARSSAPFVTRSTTSSPRRRAGLKPAWRIARGAGQLVDARASERAAASALRDAPRAPSLAHVACRQDTHLRRIRLLADAGRSRPFGTRRKSPATRTAASRCEPPRRPHRRARPSTGPLSAPRERTRQVAPLEHAGSAPVAGSCCSVTT